MCAHQDSTLPQRRLGPDEVVAVGVVNLCAQNKRQDRREASMRQSESALPITARDISILHLQVVG